MSPIGLVKHFHKLPRTIDFDLFGFLNLELWIFKVGSSTDFTEKSKLENLTVLDNVQNYDRWGPSVSDSVHGWKLLNRGRVGPSRQRLLNVKGYAAVGSRSSGSRSSPSATTQNGRRRGSGDGEVHDWLT